MSAFGNLRTPTSFRKPSPLTHHYSLTGVLYRFLCLFVFFLPFRGFLCTEGQKEQFYAIAIALVCEPLFSRPGLYFSQCWQSEVSNFKKNKATVLEFANRKKMRNRRRKEEETEFKSLTNSLANQLIQILFILQE